MSLIVNIVNQKQPAKYALMATKSPMETAAKVVPYKTVVFVGMRRPVSLAIEDTSWLKIINFANMIVEFTNV